jgi:alpha-L-arabinofuranosidase
MIFLPLLAFSVTARLSDPIPITIHTDQTGPQISKELYGIFFEEINHAGDGGLSSELVRNLNFHEHAGVEHLTTDLPGWEVDGSKPALMFDYGEVDLNWQAGAAKSPAIKALGYWGIPVESGGRYRYEVTCASSLESSLSLTLEDASGNPLGSAKIRTPDTMGTYRGFITATGTAPHAKLAVSLTRPGQVRIQEVSLRPADTWKGHGLRPDLAETVDAIHPAFVRFPGGCYVEGGDWLKNRFDWKKTIAPVADRPGHLDDIWHYWSTDALGYHEYLQWCEDMHSDALFVVNCGFSHKETVPLDQLQPYVDSALDALEYALGPSTGVIGQYRARRGHPAPFPLKYVEIGNENGNGAWHSGGSYEDYLKHFEVFAKAIHDRYPGVKLVSDVRVGKLADLTDDHFYNSPEWFWRNDHYYDRYDRSSPKVYVGEYAVTSGCGKGNLRAGLAEAAWMTGLERNSDVVKMASYAPLFVNTNDRAWNPDAICFDGTHEYGTPSYWVQKLFSVNRADVYLPSEHPSVTSNAPNWGGGVGLGTWLTSAEFKDLEVDQGQSTLYKSDLSTADGWKPTHGDWAAVDGAYRSTSKDVEVRSFLSAPAVDSQKDYTVHVKARKLSGDEGFLVLFRAKPNQFLWWNIGGWGNTAAAVEATSSGGRSEIGRHIPFKVETGRWYDIEIDVEGGTFTLKIDGKQVQQVHNEGVPSLAVSAGRVSATGEVIVKLVNGSDQALDTTVTLAGSPASAWSGTQTVLTSDSATDENSFDDPTKVAPKVDPVRFAKSAFGYSIPPHALVILRLKAG